MPLLPLALEMGMPPMWVAHDPSAHDFSEALVGYRDDGGFADAGMGHERVLDLHGEEVFATANDDVFDPADDCRREKTVRWFEEKNGSGRGRTPEITIVVKNTFVTCVHP